MKIIFLSARFYPQIGGVEKHCYEVATRLISLGHSVTIITEDTSVATRKNYTHNNRDKIEVYYLPFGKNGFSKKFRIWFALFKNRHLFSAADIIHCHDVFFWYLPLRFWFLQKKVFTTFHGYESYPIRWQAKVVRKISEKLSWGNICIGDFIQKWYGTKPTYISYGGVDITKVKSEKIKTKNKLSALFIGRLDEQTGIITYAEAVKYIRKNIPKFGFTIIGDGEYKNRFKNIGVIKGFVKDGEKQFSEHQFAFVSRYLAILEALAAKRFVIAVYDNPVKEDYLRMASFAPYISIVNSAEEVAELGLEYIKNPSVQRKKIETGYRWVKKQSWDEVVKLYLKLWKSAR